METNTEINTETNTGLKENLPKKVIKRDSSIADFDIKRIENSIKKAMIAVDPKLLEKQKEVVEDVLKVITEKFNNKEPYIEEIQDIIEISLMRKGLFEVAKAYILYRKQKAEIREEKLRILNKDKLDEIDKRFSVNALRVLASRYLIKDDEGEIIESVKELFERVSTNIILPELIYDEKIYSKETTDRENNLQEIEEIQNNFEQYDKKYSIGRFKINKYHFERLINLFKEKSKEKRIKTNIQEFLRLLEEHYFDKYQEEIEECFNLMAHQDFMPNTPALINSGRKLGMLSACFTLDIEDDMNSIMTCAHQVAIIQKCGGGTGINFSKLRPKDDVVASTKGVSSGPISFMTLIDAVSNVIKQGGVRRGANMGILEDWHPDILDFVKYKGTENVLTNFNLSVGLWDNFFDALLSRKSYPLINPRNKKIVKEQDAGEIFDLISYYAWSTADPGVLFLDKINEFNVLEKAKKEKIRVTNPCGEEPLYPYESCNLASINLANFVINNEFDWERFHDITKKVARYLDNMIDINKYPLEEIEKTTKQTRRIGVGLMGLAEALFLMNIKYNSKKGYELMNKINEHLTYYSFLQSTELSDERDSFPLYDETSYLEGKLPIKGFYETEYWTLNWNDLVKEIKTKKLRNAMVTTCPPTGSVSMICDTTSGIEPIFALVFEKRVTVGNFFYVDPIFKKELEQRKLYSEELLKKISENYGSIQGIKEIPEELKEIFVTAMDIHWIDHIIAQAEMQRWITDSISKTINMTLDVNVDDVKSAYIIAHELGCKGVTVYRDGSKTGQVLNVDSETKTKAFRIKPSKASYEKIKKIIEKEPRITNIISTDRIFEKDLNKKLELFIHKTENHAEKDHTKNNRENKNLEKNKQQTKIENNTNKEEYCPVCGSKLSFESGCKTCHNCGWSACTIS